MFNKKNMTGDAHAISGEIETLVSIMIGTITEEDTWKGMEIHFVFIIWMDMRITQTTKKYKNEKSGL